MNRGPLRRLVGFLGLLALAPIAFLLLTGAIKPVAAAQRSLVVLLVVIVIGRVTGSYLHSVARGLDVAAREQTSDQAVEPGARGA